VTCFRGGIVKADNKNANGWSADAQQSNVVVDVATEPSVLLERAPTSQVGD
jgi:hypothetical protein